jgi:PII-like signaling protein
MQPGQKAKRLRVYVSEDDHVGHQAAYVAIVGLLKREHAAGATVLRGLEGFGSAGVIHTVNLGDLVEKLPMVIEWVDTPERVDRLLPELEQMVPRGLITVDETVVVLCRRGGSHDGS